MTELRGYRPVKMPHPGRATSGTSGAERCEHLWPMSPGDLGLFDCGSKGVFALERGELIPIAEPRALELRAKRQRMKAGVIEPPNVAPMRVAILGAREYRMRFDAKPPAVEHYKQLSADHWQWQTDRELPVAMSEMALWDRGASLDYWFVAPNGDVWAMLDGAKEAQVVLELAKVKALHQTTHVDAVNAWPIAISRDTALVVHTSYHASYLTLIGPNGVKALVPPPEPPVPPREKSSIPEPPDEMGPTHAVGPALASAPAHGVTPPRFARVARVGSHTFLIRDRDLLEIMRDGTFSPWSLPEGGGFSSSSVSAHEANDVIAFVGQVHGASSVFVCQSYECKRLPVPKDPIAVHFDPHHGLIVFDSEGVGYVDSVSIQRCAPG